MAYLRVHARAVSSCLAGFVRRSCAISGTSGSLGFGSQSSELIDSNTFAIVSAGDHASGFRMSRQIVPFALMLQWYVRVVNETFGGLNG